MSELSTLGNILLFTFLGSIGALLGGVILLSKEKASRKLSHFLASFAAGTLLGAAFFDLLPEAAHQAEETGIDVFLWTFIGIAIFFLIERFIHTFHHHENYDGHDVRHESRTTIPLIIISDTLHNFLDGVVIAATFLVNIPLGVITTFAVIAHEIPQEIGDMGLLVHKGMKRGRVIFVNIVSACAAFAGAVLTYIVGVKLVEQLSIFLALTAGFFIYIALSDLIPEIHHEKRKGYALLETALLLLGVLLIYLSVSFLEHGR